MSDELLLVTCIVLYIIYNTAIPLRQGGQTTRPTDSSVRYQRPPGLPCTDNNIHILWSNSDFGLIDDIYTIQGKRLTIIHQIFSVLKKLWSTMNRKFQVPAESVWEYHDRKQRQTGIINILRVRRVWWNRTVHTIRKPNKYIAKQGM